MATAATPWPTHTSLPRGSTKLQVAEFECFQSVAWLAEATQALIWWRVLAGGRPAIAYFQGTDTVGVIPGHAMLRRAVALAFQGANDSLVVLHQAGASVALGNPSYLDGLLHCCLAPRGHAGWSFR